MLKKSGGRYTATQVARCAQMSGAFGKEMQRILCASGIGQTTYKQNIRKPEEMGRHLKKLNEAIDKWDSLRKRRQGMILILTDMFRHRLRSSLFCCLLSVLFPCPFLGQIGIPGWPFCSKFWC